ncbi:MAG: putative Ig domain-containing protein, partial [Candidatus Margulisbacteria bacterium]|nr:putative Ig domain-containing protein [Candidatus Margulisiibacteriota bacterium]
LSFVISATDPDNNPLSYSASNLPSGASFNASTRTFSWTPTYDQSGTYNNITFTVSDGSLTDSESITITVNNVNRAPSFTSTPVTAATVGMAYSYTASASDPDGNTLTYSAPTLPSWLSFNAATRVLSGTPSSAGSFSVTLRVSDGSSSTDQAFVVTVTAAPNRAPTLDPVGNRTVNENETLSFTISATDPDNDPLTYTAVGLPDGATFNSSTRSFSWMPDIGQAGSYFVSFAVSDGSLSDSETIVINAAAIPPETAPEVEEPTTPEPEPEPTPEPAPEVEPEPAPTPEPALPPSENIPPIITPIGSQTVKEGFALSFLITATDPNGDKLEFSADSLPEGATFDTSSHSFNWTPVFGSAGEYEVYFMVSDGTESVSETIFITVEGSVGISNVTINSVPYSSDRKIYVSQRPVISGNIEASSGIDIGTLTLIDEYNGARTEHPIESFSTLSTSSRDTGTSTRISFEIRLTDPIPEGAHTFLISANSLDGVEIIDRFEVEVSGARLQGPVVVYPNPYFPGEHTYLDIGYELLEDANIEIYVMDIS